MSPTTLIIIAILVFGASLAVFAFTLMAWMRSKSVVEHATRLVQLADGKSKNAAMLYEQAAGRIKIVQELVSLPALQRAVQNAAMEDLAASDELQALIQRLQVLATSAEPDKLMELEASYSNEFKELMKALGVKDAKL